MGRVRTVHKRRLDGSRRYGGRVPRDTRVGDGQAQLGEVGRYIEWP